MGDDVQRGLLPNYLSKTEPIAVLIQRFGLCDIQLKE